MSAGWVAGSVRARALARRRLGPDSARQVAACRSLREALGLLAGTPYAEAGKQSQALAAVQHAIVAEVLWNYRVLAGWLPRGGLSLMRPLAGWFELANIDELIEDLDGRAGGQRFELGALATAWPRLREVGSLAELRAGLAASPWKDPGGSSRLEIRAGVRARWAERVAALGGPAAIWAAGAAALLLAGERFAARRSPNPAVQAAARNLLGPAAAGAVTLADLRDRLPSRLAWVLAPAQSAGDLWRAEAAWYARVERDGLALLRSSAPDWHPVLGAAAVLATDARRAGAALELAARGGTALEAYDALA
ncbi:MAG TPA: hypothetical protein VMC83_41725 [Streptosporangiaceae bacterium]|nr:hypothetical protein [Streptosporangiaceae bacterium]